MRFSPDLSVVPILVIATVGFVYATLIRNEQSKYINLTSAEIKTDCLSQFKKAAELDACVIQKDPNVKDRTK